MGLFIIVLFFYLFTTLTFSILYFLVDDSFVAQVTNNCFGYACILVFLFFNIFICYLLI